MRLLRFRSLEDYERAERALDEVPTLTSLPGGVLAVDDAQYDLAISKLEAAGIDWRWEPVEGFIAGRVLDEERE